MMNKLFRSSFPLFPALLLPLAVTGCDDTAGPGTFTSTPLGVVVNSVDNSLTVFPVDAPDSTMTIGLGGDGTPVGAAVAEELMVVPLGLVPAAAVVDLRTREVRHTVALPANSGATGAAFFGTDSALVSNPQLNTVSVVDAAAGTAGPQIEAGPYPETVVVDGRTAYVVNRHLGDDYAPTGSGTVTVVDLNTLSVTDTIHLTGTNSGAAALDGDRLYILNSGSWGQDNGSLSMVDTGTGTEIHHMAGLGNFPGSLSLGPDGLLYIGSFSYGVAIMDPGTRSFVRSPEQALQPGGSSAVSAVGFDAQERMYTLRPFCTPGEADIAYRLTATLAVDRPITVGNCPLAIVFTEIKEND